MKTKINYTRKEIIDKFESYLERLQKDAEEFAKEQLEKADLTEKSFEELKKEKRIVDPKLRKYIFATRADMAFDVANKLKKDIKESKAYRKKFVMV